jgi:hypothetical protein
MSKNLTCSRDIFQRKTNIFSVLRKTKKFISCKTFLTLNFYFFTHNAIFFSKRISEHIEFRHLHAIFFVRIVEHIEYLPLLFYELATLIVLSFNLTQVDKKHDCAIDHLSMFFF